MRIIYLSEIGNRDVLLKYNTQKFAKPSLGRLFYTKTDLFDSSACQ